MGIEIINGKIFVEGIETTNPELIGYAVLDLAEHYKNIKNLPDKGAFQAVECRTL